MGFALRKHASEPEQTGGGIPLKKRLHAWWNGYDLRPRSSAHPGLDDDVGAMADAARTGDGQVPHAANPWSESRRRLAQALWSAGFVVPGGNGYVEKLVSGCNLTAAETMLEIGVGMGGGPSTIIGKFGNYVTGYEPDAALAAAARQHAAEYGFDEKLEVIEAPFESIELKPGYFRAALLRDILYTIEDKAGLLDRVADSLKSGESFLIITDLLFSADDTAPELKAWMAVEEGPVYPWTVDELTKCLASKDVTPRIVEDESDDYRAMVVDAWKAYLKTVDRSAVSDEAGRQMEREGEYWARRVAAIEAGALKYYRIEGVKVS